MKDNLQDTDLALLGIRLRFRSEHAELQDFIEAFTGLSAPGTERSEPHIHVTLKFNENFSKDNTYHKISRNIWLGDSAAFISEIERFPGLSLSVRVDKDILYVNAFLSEKNPDFLRKVLYSLGFFTPQNTFKFIGIIYYLIYFPYLYYLERFRNLCLLHAGAFEYRQQGVILAGLGGVGKSTFSLGTLSLDGGKILSDNLIFHDTQKIYPFPEPITVNPNMTTILGQLEQFLIPQHIASSHNRMYYHIKPELFSPNAIPKYLVWLQWGNGNKLVPLEKKTCVKALLNINLLAKELREYYVLAAAFDLAFSQSLSPNSYSENLSALLSKLDCYILQFKPGEDIKTVFNETLAGVIL